MHALIGPNGAGKSTCLNVLTGVYRADRGAGHATATTSSTALRPHRIAGLGVAARSRTSRSRRGRPSRDNLLVGRHRLMRVGLRRRRRCACRRRAASGARHRARVREIAALLGLDAAARRARSHSLSYGDRKRVELARALCAEPVAAAARRAGRGHDARRVEGDGRDDPARSARELGISILLVEHDMAFVMGLADRVTVLDFGRRIADGTPAEVQHDPEVLRAYLGGGSRVRPVPRPARSAGSRSGCVLRARRARAS